MKTSAVTLSVFLILSSFLFISKVDAQSEGEIGISASVTGCNARVLIKPEKRLPKEENFSNNNLIIFYDQLYQELFRFENVQTDNNGYADIDLCTRGYTTQPGIYSIYVKGYSHIGKLYIENKGFFNYSTFFDLAKTIDDYLIAGDTTGHDYINSLDINNIVSRLYNNDTKEDLNRDGIINSLDLSIQLYNLHKAGDLKL